MSLHGLSWRVGLPFLILVLVETLTLAGYLTSQIATESRQRLERLAHANARFIAHSGLPPTERLARDLSSVTGFEVHFRSPRGIVPPPRDAGVDEAVRASKADGVVARGSVIETVAVGLDDHHELVFARRTGGEFQDPRMIAVLVAFWVLAVAFAWIVVRRIVRPLRALAAKIPHIDSRDPIDLPEVNHNDEIGDLARAVQETRHALHDEREARTRIERVATLGRMTASLAHEVQNPVAAVKMHAQLLRGSDAEPAARVIEHEVARIEDLLNQWLFLSRPTPPALGAHDLGDVVDGVVGSFRPQLEHAGVRVEARRRGDMDVACDRKRVVHVFGNLLTNAIQSMSHGGTIDIDVDGTDAATVIARVRDQGPGFSNEALHRFGEFFFSEKEGGMGIGLGVAQEIVAAHGGSLGVENTADGACVTVSLARAAHPEALRA